MKRQIEFVSTIRYGILIFLAQTLLEKSCSSCGTKVVVVPGYHEHFVTQEEDAWLWIEEVAKMNVLASVLTGRGVKW